MYKMLVVEDEAIEREGLRDLIDWDSFGVQVVAFVGSGDEAIQVAEQHPIDILFTDIQMIGMTGLELADQLKRNNPNVKVIINSGHQEFEYAKESVRLHAFSFLSKPIEMSELSRVLTQVIEKCRKEEQEKNNHERLKVLLEQNLPLIKDRFFTNIIHGCIQGKEIAKNLEYFNIDLVYGQFTVILYELDSYPALIEKENWEEMQLVVMQILDIIQEMNIKEILYTFYISQGKFCSILNTGNQTASHIRVQRICEWIQEKIHNRYAYDTSVGIGSMVNCWNELKRSYEQAENALQYRFFMGSNQIISYHDLGRETPFKPSANLEELQTQIVTAIEIGDSEGVKKEIHHLFIVLNQGNCHDAYVRSICFNLMARISVMLFELNEDFEKVFGSENIIWDKILKLNTLFSIQQWILDISQTIIQYLQEKKLHQNRKIINKIVDFIAVHYGEMITISDIANYVYLSPNYISIIFKKETGKTFTDYLIYYRLEKAKELLKDPSAKVYEVGNAVGYTNISYFCSIFKKLYGVSPSEYKEKS